MHQKIYTLLISISIVSGCAANLPPKVNIPENARIGVMILIDENPKHVHVGTTAFNNFEKDNVSSWDIKDKIYKQISSSLNEFSVTEIPPSETLITHRLEFISSGWDDFYLNKDLVEEVSKTTSKYNIDFLITIEPYSYQVEINSAISAHGYGLLTRCMFNICRAEALNHVSVNVYAMNPPRLLSWGINKNSKLPVEISFADDVDALPKQEIDKAEPKFTDYIFVKIDSALERSGLKMDNEK